MTAETELLQIMYNSTTEDIRDNLDRFIENGDAPGLWTQLATFNPASDNLFNFNRETYQPPSDTISSYATRLHKEQRNLASTPKAITDEQLRSQLIEGLPDEDIWQTARLLLVNQFPNFEETTQYLRGIEDILVRPPESSSATANNRQQQRQSKRQRKRQKRRQRKRQGQLPCPRPKLTHY